MADAHAELQNLRDSVKILAGWDKKFGRTSNSKKAFWGKICITYERFLAKFSTFVLQKYPFCSFFFHLNDKTYNLHAFLGGENLLEGFALCKN